MLTTHTKADTAGPATVGEILVEEFLKPPSMSHNTLAEAMGLSLQDIEDLISGQRRLKSHEESLLTGMFGTDEDFWNNLQMLQERQEKQGEESIYVYCICYMPSKVS